MSEPQFVRRNIDGLLIQVSGPKEEETEIPLYDPAKHEERDTKTIAGKFAEALGSIEDAICYLGQVNEQYHPQQYADEICLVADYGLPPCNPVMDFWLQAELAEDLLKDILYKLQRVEQRVPKEVVKV